MAAGRLRLLGQPGNDSERFLRGIYQYLGECHLHHKRKWRPWVPSRQPTPAKKLETSTTEMEKVYHALSTGSATQRARWAFDKSFEAGVLWNPQIFSLLDMAEHR